MNIFGSIIGDVSGSYYEVKEVDAIKCGGRSYEERIKILDKSVNLFNDNCSFTDDSILTTSVCDAIINNGNYENYIRLYGNKEKNLGTDKYGRSRFGKGFISWLDGGDNKSFGNGCAMRVSPIGYAFSTLEETLEEAEKSTICSHNNYFSIVCAKAVAGSIFLARNGASKNTITEFASKLLGDLNFNLEDLQKNYKFTSRAIESVPQAIYCFLISSGFEDCIRKSISIGGDSDTIACIAGGIAGAFYDVPQHLINEVKKYVPLEYMHVLEDFNNKYVFNKSENIKYSKE